MNDEDLPQSQRPVPERPDVDEVLAEYIERVDRGEHVDRNSLLKAHPEIADELRAYFSDLGVIDTTRAHDSVNYPTERWIGPYHLLQKLGAGGMGEVWRAEQKEPVRRQVAVKLIKVGAESTQVLARFEAERQALAMMNHPNIARFLDAGATDDGQPFVVMELVQGKPFTTYCDENRLGIDERLELFIGACNGVQHAHQKGIIHRDLKPSNILVSVVDGKPVPKVIDFGLAKALEATQRLTDQSLHSAIGQVLGTYRYMSPEQADVNSNDIDTRTDIYALGVMLYELLTGSVPLDDSTIQGEAILKVLEFIREKEPIKPSSKLGSSTDEQISTITSKRKTDSVRLSRILAGDLDWIVLKALEKDRTRRYESASGFAADVKRYLNNEPVIARPPSVSYRVQKFVRKNRVAVIAAALVGISLLGGIAGTTWGMMLASHRAEQAKAATAKAIDARDAAAFQRKLAEQAEADAKRDRDLAEKRRQEAELNLAYAKKGNEILGSVFTDLDPKAEYATVADLRNALADNLENSVKELEGTSIGDPLAVAEMQMTLGLSLLGLGQPRQAEILFDRALETRTSRLGPDHPETLNSMNNLASAYHLAGELSKAIPLNEQTVKLRKSKLGPDHPDTLNSMNNLAVAYIDAGELSKALPLLEQTLDMTKAKLGLDHSDTLTSMNNLAEAYSDAGELSKALPLYEQTLKSRRAKLGLNHPETLNSMNNLALAYSEHGDLSKAIALHEQTLELKKAKLGLDHPDTLNSMNNLALAYNDAGETLKAISLYENTLELRKAELGPDHPSTLTSMNNLALGYSATGDLPNAIPLFEQALVLRKAKLGPDHPDTLQSMNNLAVAYGKAGDLSKALPLFEQTLELTKAKLGPNHPDTLVYMNSLAVAYYYSGETLKAISLYEQALELQQAKVGDDHPHTLGSMNNLAEAYKAAGELVKAIEMHEQTLELRNEKLGPDHPDTLQSMNNLAVAYGTAGDLSKALPLFEETLELMKANLGPDHPETLGVMNNLAEAYAKGKRVEEFQKLRSEYMTSVRKRFDGGSLQLAGVLVSTGSEYLELGLFRDAEKLLREGVEIRAREAPDAWTTFNSRSCLGGALTGLASETDDDQTKTKLLAEAEPLLVGGYEGMQERVESIPEVVRQQRIFEALDRLIAFYSALENTEEAEKYRQLRSGIPQAKSEDDDD
jgi:serine/threonine protein kinase